MSDLQKSKKILKEHKKLLQENYNIKKIGIFGSVAKGYSQKSSDIDILVEFKKTPGFFGFIRLEDHLSVLLNRKVDMVTKNALKPIMRKEIMKSIKYV